MAFIADDSGHPEAYVQAFEAGDSPRLTGERKQVSRGGAVFLRWRPDDKELFYLASDGRVYAVSMEPFSGEPEPLFSIPVAARAVLPTAFGFDVSRDGRRFLIATATAAASLTVVQNWESSLTPSETAEKKRNRADWGNPQTIARFLRADGLNP